MALTNRSRNTIRNNKYVAMMDYAHTQNIMYAGDNGIWFASRINAHINNVEFRAFKKGKAMTREEMQEYVV